jgi:hypothetical protein
MSQSKYGAAKIVDVFSLPNIWHGYDRSPRCRGHQALVQPATNATPTSQPTHTARRHYNAVTPPISPSTTLGILSVALLSNRMTCLAVPQMISLIRPQTWFP